MRRLITAALVSLALVACSDSSGDYVEAEEYASESYDTGYLSQSGDDYDEFADPYVEEERGEFDEDAARRRAEDDLALEGYDYSYGCTDDCSGHEAGWQWRADNGYSTYGNSQSFAEGGYAFDDAVEDRVESMRDDYEAGSDEFEY